MRSLFAFPNPVNEISARLVAAGVVVMSVGFLLTGSGWILALLAYGFVARVLTGPTLSPLGQLVTRVVTPRLPLEPRWTPGPPKRFAQGIGATLTVAASVAFVVGAVGLAQALVAAVLVAATLESALGYCLGCKVFALLMRVGAVPASVCEDCADITRRLERAA